MLCLLFGLLALGPVTLEPVRTLTPPPEDQDLFLQNILHVEIDDDGIFYATDFPSARIYRWRPDGGFDGFFGGKGQGPGEFGFAAALGPPLGYINRVDGNFYIYDGASRTLSILNKQHEFVRRVTFEKLGGKINGFHALSSKRFLFYDSYFCDEKPCRRILEYNDQGKLIKSWHDSPDKTWEHNRNTNKVKLFIWEPIPVLHFSRQRGEVVLAHSSRPVLEVYDSQGTLKRTLTLEIPRPEVTKDDIAEYNAQPWLKDAPQVVPVFPDQKNYFNRVLTVKEGYLVYHLSPFHGIAKGYLVDFDGKLKGRFTWECGEGGGLFAPRGRLMSARIDDEGDLAIQELRLRL
ncbi:hypothetical protein [Acanthopleuribacter pedis]|uniref:6-bladed beta-propeller n=1 Tax=Acanthopleuribacter pedis TaxID=442870 RepID=A0A8J7Q337_9BACT|nr:hypothetical protein [Acanthopleuribacter pedis]MBO1319642.1 hypothetical protein [Acanthopleuribacter pedis]